jgi:hypothetical protein
MPQLSKGQTFSVNDTVTNTKLHTLVDNGTLASGAITEQNLQAASLSTSDVILFTDVSATPAALSKLELAKLWAEPFEIGQTNKVTANFALVSSPVAQFTSASIANLTGASSITGSAPSIAKAWVNFNGRMNGSGSISLTTSTQSAVGTLVTANFATAHNLATGDSITITTYASAPLIGTWVVTVTSGTQITFNTATAPTISATFTVYRVPVRSSYNVTSVGFEGVEASGNNKFTLNFTPGTFSDTNYCVLGTCGQYDTASSTGVTYSTGIALTNTTPFAPILLTSSQCTVVVQQSDGSNILNPQMHFVAFR